MFIGGSTTRSSTSISASRILTASTAYTSRRALATTRPTMLALTKYRAHPSTPNAPQPRTLEHQPRLPRLPVPPLEQTLGKYLRSLEPILLQLEEQGKVKSAQQELEKRKQWAETLLQEGGLGTKLQQRLLDVDATTPNNWLDDRYWLQKAYHEWRVPLMINSNWWLLFTNDPSLQPASASQAAPAPKGGKMIGGLADDFEQARKLAATEGDAAAVPEWSTEALLGGPRPFENMDLGVRRAAWLAWRFAEFKLRLDRQDILPDSSRAGPFCMHQYTNVYGVTRIPALPHDWNTRPAGISGVPEKLASRAEPPSRHLTVIIRNHFYELQIIEPTEGKIVKPEEIEKALQAIVQDAQSREDGEGVGVLSSDARDQWAVTREHLLSISPVNRATVRSIETSLFAIALDTTTLPLPANYPAPPSSASSLWVDALARNTSGAGRGGHNRWFDKSITLSVEPNGRAGMNGEHSPVDALIPSILADYATGVPCPPLGQPFPAVDTTPASELSEAKADFKRLEWKLDGKIRDEIRRSTNRAVAIGADSDIRVLYFDEYGADWIKKIGKQSPDAYLQQALQVAMALTHGGWQVPTYETASTRLFRNGRTDVIRSFSLESFNFVKALVRDRLGESKTGAERKAAMKRLYKLLSAATTAHNAQTRESSMGKGIDRHLTGLRLVYNATTDEAAGGVPELLSDPLFGQSQTWTLSTSGLSAGDRLAGTGFGAGYPDGYGCNYLAGGRLLKFGFESKYSHPETSTTTFTQNLVKALRMMKEVCEEGVEAAEGAEKQKL